MNTVIRVLLLLFSLISNAQDFNPKTISLPENVTVEDLSFLKDELKDVQVVMLGELDHHDGNVFEMKTKVVKYLHQYMGFKTIAFESGVYDVWKAQQEINKGEDAQKAFLKSLFGIWAGKKEFQSFINYFDSNKTDLKLYGFDSQITGVYGNKGLIDGLYEFCKKYDYSLKLNQNDLSLLIETMNKSWIYDDEDIAYNQYTKELNVLLSQIQKRSDEETHFYWGQVIKSILVIAEECNAQEKENFGLFYASANYNYRDKQMAENLLAYVRRYPNEKIICWGASVHFVNDMSSINTPILKDYVPMGQYIKNALKEKAYSLTVINAADSWTYKSETLETPIEKGSFEYYLKNKGVSNLFVSSNQPEMRKMKSNRFFSVISFVPSRLDLLYDGYVYLDEVKKSTNIDFDENDYDLDDSQLKNNLVVIPSKSRHSKNDLEHEKPIGAVVLEEVVVYGKRATRQLVKRVIDSLKRNYPHNKIYSKVEANITATINHKKCLDVDFIANQYEKGYFGAVRSMKELKEVQWNMRGVYEPNNLWEFYGLMRHNPIRYANFLNPRKFKKFDFVLEEVKQYNGKEVFVISFSSPRDHLTYTRRMYFSDYTGVLYINKDDFALVKVIEDWKVKKLTERQEISLNLKRPYSRYSSKEYSHERIETDFKKNGRIYYLSSTLIDIAGEVIDIEKSESLPFTTRLDVSWSNFNTINPIKIKFKEEKLFLHDIKYNESFWNNYTCPNKE
ncbi:MAG: erythromycin esterase family protein [Flavobacteriales bacterium]|nr:erythromycin esterase family protein [Flavobacteriales bacterium]